MKTFAGILVFVLLAGCAKEEPKPEQNPAPPPAAENPTPPPEPAAEPTPAPTPAPTKAPQTPPAPAVERGVTISGEVIDVVSYAVSGVVPSSPSGKEIITASAGGGNPLGILEKKSGTVYLVTMKQANTSANSALLPFVGLPVTVKGDVYRKGTHSLLVMSTVGKSMQ